MPEQILIVEDDVSMARGIRDVLEIAGYKVEITDNGRRALIILETFRPQLIISDIMMPEMDGYELLEKVRSRAEWVTIPFIFLTAKGQRIDIRVGKQLGADDYLVKSVDLDDLLVVVRAKLDRALALNQRTQAEMANLKNSILNTLSHEFRTPLTYITGYVDLLQEGTWGPEDLQRFLSRIKGGSSRLNKLIEDFLLLVRFETNDARQSYDMDKEPFSNWAAMLGRIFADYQEQADRHKVELVTDLQPELPLLEAHEDLLDNAFRRLVDNAIRFSKPQGGRVTVKVTSDGKWVVARVIDQGIGIPPAELPKMFDRFHQINREHMEQQGAGIGLAIVKGVIELHKGQIECLSQEGVGSELIVRLPVL